MIVFEAETSSSPRLRFYLVDESSEPVDQPGSMAGWQLIVNQVEADGSERTITDHWGDHLRDVAPAISRSTAEDLAWRLRVDPPQV